MDDEAIEALRSVLETRYGVAETTGSKVREIAAALRAAGYVIERDWRPIEEAPKDGTPIQARILGHGDDKIIAWQGGLVDANGEGAGCWAFVDDQEPPACWTDGVCWAINEDGVASLPPTYFRPLPKPPKE